MERFKKEFACQFNMLRQKSKNEQSKYHSFSRTKKLIAGAAIVASLIGAGAYASIHYGIPNINHQSNSSYSQVIGSGDYRNVLENRVLAKDYVGHLNKTMPEVIKAKKEGLLQGVYYNPTDRELEEIVKQNFANIPDFNPSKGEFQSSLDYLIGIANYRRAHNDIMSTHQENLSNKKNYSFIIVWPGAFNNDSIIRDGDFRLAIIHELTHAKDHYDGISYNGRLIDQTKLSENFLKNLLELRAVDKEIESALNNPKEISDAYIVNRFGHFVEYRDSLCPANEYERQIKERQLAENSVSVVVGENFLKAYLNKSPGFSAEVPIKSFNVPRPCP